MAQRVYEIDRLPVGMELSDIDRAALYGKAEESIEESENDDRKE